MQECSGELEQQVPFPFNLLPPESEPFPTIDAASIVGHLLENLVGLSGSLHMASLQSEMEQQELSMALHVLAEYARATRAVFERWSREPHPVPTRKEEGSPHAERERKVPRS